jgi:TusA-related sulfurtransferase
MCPLPMMKLMQCRDILDRGERVLLITDHSCTCESILSYCRAQKIEARVEEPISGIWEITLHAETPRTQTP